MSKQTAGFHLKLSILYLQEAKFSYILMSLLFISSLLLWGIAFLIDNNSKKIIDDKKANYNIIAYLKKDVQKDKFKKVIEEFSNISSIEYISPENVKSYIQKEDKKTVEFINSLQLNPYPQAYSITLKKEVWSKDTVKDLVDFLAKRSEIDEVYFGENIIDNIIITFRNIEIINSLLFYVSLIVGLLIMFMVSLNCKRRLTAHIERLKIIGASKRFINIPFYMTSISIGGLSSILSVALLYLGYSYISQKDILLQFLSWQYIFVIIGAGFLIPLISNTFGNK